MGLNMWLSVTETKQNNPEQSSTFFQDKTRLCEEIQAKIYFTPYYEEKEHLV